MTSVQAIGLSVQAIRISLQASGFSSYDMDYVLGLDC